MQEQYIPSNVNAPLRVAAPYSGDRTFITHADIKRIIKRYSSTILWSAATGTVLAALYAMTAVPLYTAQTQIIIDPSFPQTLREQGDGIFSIDNAQVESQIEVLKSESIAHDVITQLKLADDPAFVGSTPLRSSLTHFGFFNPKAVRTRLRASVMRSPVSPAASPFAASAYPIR